MMKNKIKLKKYLISSILIIMIFMVIFLFLKKWEYQSLIKSYNESVSKIVALVLKKYPEVDENDIMNILNGEDIKDEFWRKYYIDISNENIILKNKMIYKQFLIINMVFYLTLILTIFAIWHIFCKRKDRELKKISNYLEMVSNKNYNLEIDEISEDELSILKNELYKITVLLRESADNSLKDKMELKKSLEDISHQLKTPLTSILIMLDNLEDNDLDNNLKEEFLRDIKREVMNINFLVQNILKLSRFDVNAINFTKNEVLIKDVIKKSILNVSNICDLKNIKIEVLSDEWISINVDFHWEVEAITNILKNCIEYSKDNGNIFVSYEDNKAYVKLEIKDEGKGIDKMELPHIFERFYKGKNSSQESAGIGLSLAKTIIEKDNGKIAVSTSEEGTVFEIRYYKF